MKRRIEQPNTNADGLMPEHRSPSKARLIRIPSAANRKFGALAGKIAIDVGFHESLPQGELSGWEPVHPLRRRCKKCCPHEHPLER